MYSLNDGRYIATKPPKNLKQKLAPGFYRLNVYKSMMSSTIEFETLKRDPSLIRFTTGTVGKIVSKVESFLDTETHARYNALEIPHQMGILLHGPPGTGKTSVCRLIMQETIQKYNVIGLDISLAEMNDVQEAIKMVRETNPDNPIVLMIDEFEGYINYHNVPTILHFLDGSLREDKIVVLMCTNFLEKIEERIKYRKSRIKHMYLVDSLPLQVYKEFIKNKIREMDEETVSKFSLLAEEQKLNIDQTKHAVIDYYINGDSIEDAVSVNSKFEDNG